MCRYVPAALTVEVDLHPLMSHAHTDWTQLQRPPSSYTHTWVPSQLVGEYMPLEFSLFDKCDNPVPSGTTCIPDRVMAWAQAVPGNWESNGSRGGFANKAYLSSLLKLTSR